MAIPMEQPPVEDARLAEWLTRMMNLINADLERIDFNLVFAAYGTIRLSTPTAMADLTGGNWVVMPADQGIIPTPRYVIYDLANNGLILQSGGIWTLSINISIQHNELNAGREIGVRLYNFTQDTVITTTLVGIARNTTATNISFSVTIPIAYQAGDVLQVQIGGGDDVSALIAVSYVFGMNSSGPLL